MLLGRKVMTNLDSILKSRDITLLTKVCIVKVMVFPVVVYGCESWAMKKAENCLSSRINRDMICSRRCRRRRHSLLAAAAAAAKSLQLCPTLCDPIDSSPPGSPSLGFSRQEH